MAQVVPGVTPWSEAWPQLNRGNRLTDGLGIEGGDDTPQKVVDRLILAVATGAPLTSPSSGDGLLAVRGGKPYRIDVGGGAFAAFVAGLAAVTGTNVVPATKEDLWAGALGLLINTPESLAAAEEWQIGSAAISVSGGLISLDGAAFFSARATITADAAFGAVVNMGARPRRVRLLASGAARTITAGENESIGFGAGVVIPDGKSADFEVTADPVGVVVRHLGTSE